MKNLSERKACRCFSEWCGSLARYNVRKEYNMTLGLYPDENTDTPECSHTFKGSSRHNLLKLLALFGILTVTLSLIRMICSLFSKL